MFDPSTEKLSYIPTGNNNSVMFNILCFIRIFSKRNFF